MRFVVSHSAQAIQEALEKHRQHEQELHTSLQNAPLFPTAQRTKSAPPCETLLCLCTHRERPEPAAAAAAPAVTAQPALESVKLDLGRSELDDFLSDVIEPEAEKEAKPAEQEP